MDAANLRAVPAMAEFARRAAERKAWEEANPELTTAWNEAWKEDEARNAETEKRAKLGARAAQVREEAPARLERLGCPPRAVDLWESNKGKPNAASKALERMDNERKCIALLTGGTGVGKTCAAVAYLACELLLDARDDLPVLFVRATECARMGLYDEDDKRLAHQMRTATALVIDDLGAEFLSEGSIWRTVLDEVIDTRYGAKLTTILTTNLTQDEFKKRYGERIADRIRHAGVVESCGTGSLRARGEG